MSDIEIARRCIGVHKRQVERLTLRPLILGDYSALHAILSARDDMTWERIRATPEYTSQLLEFRLRHYKMHGFGIMAVEDEHGQVIGQAGLQVLADIDANAVEFVVFLAPTHVSMGYGTVLSRYYIGLARECGMKHLYATVRPENVPAERLVRRLGFELVGTATHFGMPSTVWRVLL